MVSPPRHGRWLRCGSRRSPRGRRRSPLPRRDGENVDRFGGSARRQQAGEILGDPVLVDRRGQPGRRAVRGGDHHRTEVHRQCRAVHDAQVQRRVRAAREVSGSGGPLDVAVDAVDAYREAVRIRHRARRPEAALAPDDGGHRHLAVPDDRHVHRRGRRVQGGIGDGRRGRGCDRNPARTGRRRSSPGARRTRQQHPEAERRQPESPGHSGSRPPGGHDLPRWTGALHGSDGKLHSGIVPRLDESDTTPTRQASPRCPIRTDRRSAHGPPPPVRWAISPRRGPAAGGPGTPPPARPARFPTTSATRPPRDRRPPALTRRA